MASIARVVSRLRCRGKGTGCGFLFENRASRQTECEYAESKDSQGERNIMSFPSLGFPFVRGQMCVKHSQIDNVLIAELGSYIFMTFTFLALLAACIQPGA